MPDVSLCTYIIGNSIEARVLFVGGVHEVFDFGQRELTHTQETSTRRNLITICHTDLGTQLGTHTNTHEHIATLMNTNKEAQQNVHVWATEVMVMVGGGSEENECANVKKG